MKNAQNNKGKTETKKVFVDNEHILICKYCKKPIKKVELIGFSLICPLCKKPQNGEPHLKLKTSKQNEKRKK